MSDIESTDFSETAGSNNAAPPNGAPEGWAPSSVNNWGREFMAAVKRQWNRAGPTVTSGGSANAHTLTYTSATVQALTRGQTYSFIAGFTNTGATTLKVDSLAATAIRYNNVALAGGEIVAGSTIVVMYDGTAYQLISPPGGTPSTAAARNYVVNGDFEVWQRGAGGSASIAVSSSSATYGPDRFYLFTSSNQASTVSQQTGLTNGSRYCARIQRNSGQTGTGLGIFGFPLTTEEVVALRGLIVTARAKVRTGADWSPTSGALSLTFNVGTGTAGKFAVGFTSGTTLASTTSNLGTSSSVTTLTAVSTAVVPTNSTQAEVGFSWTPTGTASTNDYFECDEVELVIGYPSNTFERERMEDTIARCQRHFWKSFPYATAPAQSGGVTGGINVYLGTGQSGTNGTTVLLPVVMRTTPSVTSYNPSASNANVRDTTNNADRTISVGTLSDHSIPFTFASGAAASTNVVHFTADAGL